MDKKLILIVEDDTDVFMPMLKAIIPKYRAQYDVLVCIDGLEALEFLRSKNVDLMILDLDMGNLNGLQVCQQMAAIKMLRPPEVIISSGYLDDSMIEQLKTLGVRHFLRKPYSMESLLQKVNELLASPVTQK